MMIFSIIFSDAINQKSENSKYILNLADWML